MLHVDETNIVFTFNNIKNPKNNKWYNRVYLCYENTDNKNKNNNKVNVTTGAKIKPARITRNAHFDSQIIMHNNLDIKYIIIPICKWIPTIFDSLFLHYKLKKYWLGNRYIYNIIFTSNKNETK